MSKAPWQPLDVALAAVLAAVAIFLALLVLLSFFPPLGDGGGPDSQETAVLFGAPAWLVLSSMTQGALVVAALIFSVSKYRASPKSLGLAWPRGGISPWFTAFAAWLAGLLGVYVWNVITGALGAEWLIPPDTASEALEAASGATGAVLLLIGLWGPFTEEFFFRGFALSGLLQRYGRVGALMLSSALFALAHLNPALLVPTFILGVALGWAYLMTASIWPCVFAHGLHNTLAIALARYYGTFEPSSGVLN